MEEEIQVKILGPALKADGFFAKHNDVITVPMSVAKAWCSRGWAATLDDSIPVGERITQPVTINPKKMSQTNTLNGVE